MDDSLIEYLSGFLTGKRKSKIEGILNNRTRNITVVLENIYHSQNASAVIRTCECQGIQDMHFIHDRNQYTINADVVQGASKWITIHDYSNTEKCFSKLKDNGYLLAATTLKGKNPVTPDELPIDKKLAVCFGAEKAGLSKIVHQAADFHVTIPMHGFTQSYNISVSAAMLLQIIVKKLHRSDVNWSISEEEKAELRLEWYKKSIKNADVIINSRTH